ncbi:methyltransferase domain-containing protein [Streptomyces sp. NPDC057638]|uniref:class I SAM-dependent methyltransferase n=1 Tax=Streptomyces sp. NPDC057638 TaxID=3346190 RepID=UPI003688CBD6
MAQQPQPTTDDVAQMYDRLTDLLTQALGDNIHLGLFGQAGAEHPVGAATDALTDAVADLLGPLAGEDPHLLDIGCGTGRPALRIAERTRGAVTGITVSEYQVRQARQALAEWSTARPRAAGTRFELADVTRLPYADASFDAAWAIESLLHIPSRSAALAEAHRVVRPGGRLVVADLLLRGKVHGSAKAAVEATAGIFQVASVATEQEYRQQLADVGWRVVEFTDIGDEVRPTYQRITALMRQLVDEAPQELGAQLTDGAAALDAFAALPEVGYVLLAAERS